MSEQPFAGVTVLELGQFVAVPWAGQVLGDGGAHVIKVEPPEGEPRRHIAPLAPRESRHFAIRNRAKHALPLDVRHPDAREILDALLAPADVVLINMRPGLAAELGVECEQLAPRFPRVIEGGGVHPDGADQVLPPDHLQDEGLVGGPVEGTHDPPRDGHGRDVPVADALAPDEQAQGEGERALPGLGEHQ
ncbi:MAG TPA: CoA transferase, partial [Candidatus Limnocylindrales bacterium]|nr:CoA transferase [Candidatus Limnocylindrales bacterium]